MTRHRSIALAMVLGATAIAPPAQAGDAASVLLGIAAGVLVGTTSAPPPPAQPQQPMRETDRVCLTEGDTIVCHSPVLRELRQRWHDTSTAYRDRLVQTSATAALNDFAGTMQQQEAQFQQCPRAPDPQGCIAGWFNYWIATYSARLAAPAPPAAARQTPVMAPASYPPQPPPNRSLRIAGEITDATITRFDDFMQQHPGTTTVVLDSGGGEVLTSRDLAMRIRHLHLTTVVPADAECASACFMVFAAGERRIASTSAKIGVHSASYHGEEDRDTLAVSTLMARQCAVFGVPDHIVGKMITQPGGGDVTWLSAADLRSMRVETY